ncbi:MAG: nuclear transport factor 2 family protein [Pseudomonadota bacterium]
MTDEEMIDLVRTYFSAVDRGDLDTVLSTLALDCKFTVETHGVELNGHHDLRGMFERLWKNHAAMVHDQMTFVPNSEAGRIAAQFRVVNTEHDGSITYKSNCNFFDVAYGRFSRVAVYMAGETTLDRAGT